MNVKRQKKKKRECHFLQMSNTYIYTYCERQIIIKLKLKSPLQSRCYKLYGNVVKVKTHIKWNWRCHSPDATSEHSKHAMPSPVCSRTYLIWCQTFYIKIIYSLTKFSTNKRRFIFKTCFMYVLANILTLIYY